MRVGTTLGVETHIGAFACLGRIHLAHAVGGTIAVSFTFIRIDAHVERIANETGTTSTRSTMISRGAKRIFTAQELFTRILANVDIIRAMHTDCIRWA